MPTPAQLIQLFQGSVPGAGPVPADTELLRRYAAERDEAAFAELVRRNGPLVLRACRHILGEARADDTFQAVFLLAARSADRLTRTGSLAGWLHAAAVRMAHRARRGEERRRKREATRRPPPAAPGDLTWHEVREVLDAEIAALPARYRLPLVLCYLQDLTHEAAARQIGCTVGALRGLLDRGRERLRRRLARYGLPLAAPGLVAGAPPPVSAALAARTVRAVMTGPGSPAPSALGGVAGFVLRWRVALVAPVATVVALVLAAAVQPGGAPPASVPPPPRERLTTEVVPEPAKDLLGDPLPPGAVARLGSARFQHGVDISRIFLGADGMAASYGGRGGPKLWAADTGKPVALWDGLTKPNSRVRTFQLVPAAGRLAAAVWYLDDEDGRPVGGRLVDAVTGETLRSLPLIDEATYVEVSPDGNAVAAVRPITVAGRTTSVFSVWSAGTGRWTDLAPDPVVFVNGEPVVGGVHFSADAKRVACCALNGAVRVWDVGAAKLVAQLPEAAPAARQRGSGPPTALSPDGKLLARAEQRSTRVRLWDVDTGQPLPDLADQPAYLCWSLAFSPDGKSLAGSDGQYRYRLWDLAARKKRTDISLGAGNNQARNALGFSADGKRLYAVDGSRVGVWDAVTGAPLDADGGPRGPVGCAAWSPDGTRVASGAGQGDTFVRVWDAATGRKVFDLVGHTSVIGGITYSPDGSLLATGSYDGTVRLWDPATGKELHTFAAKDGWVRDLAFAPDGRVLVSAGEKALHVWDAIGRKERRAITHQGGDSCQLVFLRGGQSLMTRDYKTGTRVIDLATGREEAPRAEAAAGTRPVRVSPSTSYLGHSGPDGTTRVVDAATGREVIALAGPDPQESGIRDVLGLAVSPDGRAVASAHWNKEVRVYEAASGTERFRFVGHTGMPFGVLFSPDGSRLCSFAGDQTLLVWDLTGPPAISATAPASAGAAWADLLDPDAKKGLAAIRYLAAGPPAALRLVAAGVKPVAAADPQAVARLVGQLEGPVFAERERASRELAALAPAVLDQLRAATEKSDAPEVRARLGEILAKFGATKVSGERLRAVRAIEVLERIGTPEAQQVLARLAAGAPGATLTRDAEAALARVKAKK